MIKPAEGVFKVERKYISALMKGVRKLHRTIKGPDSIRAINKRPKIYPPLSKRERKAERGFPAVC